MSEVPMRRMAVCALFAISITQHAGAHRLDEYLQATLIGVTRHGIEVEVLLTPGVDALPVVMAVIDRDRDGRISPEEERFYANRVRRDLEVRIDGTPAELSLQEITFPTVAEMREGLGTIRMKLRTERTGQVLQFENRHLPRISSYLVNCLASPGDGLVVGRQERDEDQKSIRFEYSFGEGAEPRTGRMAWASFWPAAIGVMLVAPVGVMLYRRKTRG
jgi:hypothetical protein